MLAHTQDFFANFAKKMGFRILETPWKFEGKSDPRWEYLDHEKMDRAKSYTLGEEEAAKLQAQFFHRKGLTSTKNGSHSLSLATPPVMCVRTNAVRWTMKKEPTFAT